jgi:hypothetical protein
MSSPEDTIIELRRDLQRLYNRATDLDLPDVAIQLMILSDLLVQKYHQTGHPAEKDLETLQWVKTELTKDSTTFRELKKFLMELEPGKE